MNRNLKEEISKKLSDEILRNALDRFAEAYPVAMARAFENVDDPEALRSSLRDMKRLTVERIDEIADRFEEEAVKRGARVFRATGGAELKRYIIDLCRERGVKRIVKSKSMASEEVDLNHALEREGIRIKETDLGGVDHLHRGP